MIGRDTSGRVWCFGEPLAARLTLRANHLGVLVAVSSQEVKPTPNLSASTSNFTGCLWNLDAPTLPSKAMMQATISTGPVHGNPKVGALSLAVYPFRCPVSCEWRRAPAHASSHMALGPNSVSPMAHVVNWRSSVFSSSLLLSC